jgi:hypothetical protein
MELREREVNPNSWFPLAHSICPIGKCILCLLWAGIEGLDLIFFSILAPQGLSALALWGWANHSVCWWPPWEGWASQFLLFHPAGAESFRTGLLPRPSPPQGR